MATTRRLHRLQTYSLRRYFSSTSSATEDQKIASQFLIGGDGIYDLKLFKASSMFRQSLVDHNRSRIRGKHLAPLFPRGGPETPPRLFGIPEWKVRQPIDFVEVFRETQLLYTRKRNQILQTLTPPHTVEETNALNAMVVGTSAQLNANHSPPKGETTEVMSQKVDVDANLVRSEREALGVGTLPTLISKMLGKVAWHINHLNSVPAPSWERNEANKIKELVVNVLKLVKKLDFALAKSTLADDKTNPSFQWKRVSGHIVLNVNLIVNNVEEVRKLDYATSNLMTTKFEALWYFDLSEIDANDNSMAYNFELARKLDTAREKMIVNNKFMVGNLKRVKQLDDVIREIMADLEPLRNLGFSGDNINANMKAEADLAWKLGMALVDTIKDVEVLEDKRKLVKKLDSANKALVADNMALLGDIVLEEGRPEKNLELVKRLRNVVAILDTVTTTMWRLLQLVKKLKCWNAELVAKSRERLRKLEVAFAEIDRDEEVMKLLMELTLALENLNRIKYL